MYTVESIRQLYRIETEKVSVDSQYLSQPKALFMVFTKMGNLLTSRSMLIFLIFLINMTSSMRFIGDIERNGV